MTKRQAVLDAINNHWREYSVPPSIRYICQKVNTSTSVVHHYYKKLAQTGDIIMSGSPGSDPKPVPVSLFNLIKNPAPKEREKESLPNEQTN